MNVAILFINIGYYHYARLASAFDACATRDWRAVGLQVTETTLEHPWGPMAGERRVPIATMSLPRDTHITAAGGLPRVGTQRVFAFLDEIQPDVIFLPGWSFEICRQCLAWCRKQSVPAVLMSESKQDDERRSWLKEKAKAALYVRRFKAALVGGAVHARYAESLGISGDRIFTGYDVVDNAHFASGADRARGNPVETRKALPNIPNRPYFIAASRMVERKNIVGLVRAYRRYMDDVGAQLAWDLVVCGNGPQFQAVRGEVSKSKLDGRVHLPGFVSYPEMPAWYGMAGAFVHPALQEQWGLVVNEACASGLPVIVGKTVGASYDLVADGKNGFLIDPANIDDMAEKLSLLYCSNKETLNQMSSYSRKLAQKLAPERFGEGVVKAVLSLQGRNV